VKEGDEIAAQQLWDRYFEQLAGLCRKKLQGHPRRSEDEEDVALSAIARVFTGLQDGVFPQVTDRDDLWRLLVRIAANKAVDRIRAEAAAKRHPHGGVARIAPRSAETSITADELDQVVGREPTPEFAAILVEESDRLLSRLSGDKLRQVAILRMEGCTVLEIAARLGTSERSVQRKLALIRREWSGQ